VVGGFAQAANQKNLLLGLSRPNTKRRCKMAKSERKTEKKGTQSRSYDWVKWLALGLAI